MTRLDYLINPLRVIENPAFKEASKEELRVLIALIELQGQAEDVKSLADGASISVARCKSALAFWEESGVIRENDGTPGIIDEFEERLVKGEIDEVPAVEVAESIRDENLALMIDDCAVLLGQACLSNSDVKNLTGLYKQYSLSADYIITLAAHLKRKGNLTVRRLCDKAITLQGKGCDSTEALDAYIKSAEESSGAEWEFRRVLGIYGRNLSPSEKGYFKKWADDFGFSVAIVTEAYDIAALNTRNGDLRYMDKILSDWHESGCKTVSECKAKAEADKLARATEKKDSGTTKSRAKSKPETPRYGEFDANDAFAKALERSYGKDSEN